MKRLIALLTLTAFPVLAQNVIQITDYDFDSESPAFSHGVMYDNSETPYRLFFEAHNGDSSNIVVLRFRDILFSDQNPFFDPKFITRDDFINKNPNVIGTNLVLWETNRSGNFDIAYSYLNNRVWSSPRIVKETADDELELSVVRDYWRANNFAVYQRNNSIYLLSIADTVFSEEEVFSSSDDILYRNPVGFIKHLDRNSFRIVTAAIKDSAGVKMQITLRIKDENGEWNDVKIINAPNEPDNLSFDYYGNLIFDNISSGKKSIYIVKLNESSFEAAEMMSDSNSSVSNYNSAFAYYFNPDRTYPLYPFIYEMSDEAQKYIATSIFNNIDSVLVRQVKVDDPQPVVGFQFEEVDGFQIFYSVWVDSANGHKNLFGMAQGLIVGSADNIENAPAQFKLYQNYPNPFNPTTTIKYSIPNVVETKYISSLQQWVTLKIYDILGAEVAVLVNEYKSPGNYKAVFDASNLSSGIYFYRLNTRNYSTVKKMILLR